MISPHDSIENGGREQGVLGPIHVYRRLVNNTHRKKQAQEFFCFFLLVGNQLFARDLLLRFPSAIKSLA